MTNWESSRANILANPHNQYLLLKRPRAKKLSPRTVVISELPILFAQYYALASRLLHWRRSRIISFTFEHLDGLAMLVEFDFIESNDKATAAITSDK